MICLLQVLRDALAGCGLVLLVSLFLPEGSSISLVYVVLSIFIMDCFGLYTMSTMKQKGYIEAVDFVIDNLVEAGLFTEEELVECLQERKERKS